jgi:hypothetical protein
MWFSRRTARRQAAEPIRFGLQHEDPPSDFVGVASAG